MIDQSSMRAAIDEIQNADPAVELAAICSHDGLVMVSTSETRDDAEVVAAIASELLSKGRLASTELELGALHSELIFGEQGGIFLRVINDEIILVVRVGLAVRVGATVQQMNRIAGRLAAGF
ncbi:MAG: roadblock/LC7 domain-containing protein [Candidatus Dadabacteria bacterium]|nr:MAG: roadblock/LC7 domain-containing protein [Candidatus Dadabacteria bacterium]